MPRTFVQLDAFGASPILQQGNTRLSQRLSGVERSECRSYGRQGTAVGNADVVVLEESKDSIAFNLQADSTSYGGHYRSCAQCVLGNCVGVMGNDTSANANTRSTAVVAITFSADPGTGDYLLDLGVASQGQSPSVAVTNTGGAMLQPVSGTPSTYRLAANSNAVYYVSATVEAKTSNSGGCCVDQKNMSSRVDLRMRKAPLLASQGKIEPFIKGGVETKAYPYVGAFLIDGELHCTGTLVGARTVLTAAHCLQGYESQIEKFSFVVGSNLFQLTFGPIPIQSFAYPDDAARGFRFNPSSLEDDIGVVYLASDTAIAPARLHSGSPRWSEFSSSSLTFVGYGFDVVENQLVGAGVRREASWGINVIENRRVRFAVPRKNTCKGDSGGPAFLIANDRITLVAVTSAGSSDCSNGIETRVDAYLPWLEGRIR